MKIVCNVRSLDNKLTGIQRYINNVISNFPEDIYKKIAPLPNVSHGIKGHYWEQFILPRKLAKNEILWSPSNTGPISLKNQVVTIHDLVAFDHKEWVSYSFGKLYRYMQPKLARNAAHIITVSNFSKERIIENLKIPEHKISVIYNGVEDKFFAPCTNDFSNNIPFKRYILALGAIEPRKNLNGLLTAWNNIKSSIDENIGLVVVGTHGSTKVFGNYQIDKKIDRVFFTGYVDEKYLVSLYSNALCFAYLSFYEGFGFPPLEAMATGCPVLSSNQTAMREIIGYSGLLVDPGSSSEIESGLIKYINDENLRLENSKKGKERAKEFNWKNASLQTLEVFKNI